MQGERLYHFELSDKNRTVRWILIAVFLVVAVVAVGLGIMGVLKASDGWQRIEPGTSNMNCSHQFTLTYDLGAGEASATAEKKALSTLYGDATEKAWHIFYSEAGELEGVNGINWINSHPNEEVAVAPELYQALLQLKNDGTRALYFGPVYTAYDQVFFSVNDVEAELCDPATNPVMMEYVTAVAAYANDPESVNLELRGENKVFLKVSAEYAAFLEENGASATLDFGWLRNAFVIDYMAKRIEDAGFTNGYLSSVDGFTRNLDRRDTGYGMDLFLQGKGVAKMGYRGGLSMLCLRSYPMSEGEAYRYYTYADGRTVVPYIDLHSGTAKTAADQLITYSTEYSCAELAMFILPVYTADSLDEGLLQDLGDSDIHSIWFAGTELHCTQSDLTVEITDTAAVSKVVK